MSLFDRFAIKRFLYFFACLLVFSASIADLSRDKNTFADTSTSPWLAAEAPRLKNLKEDIDFSEIPVQINGNQECLVQQKFVTRPARVLPRQTEQSFRACGVDTPYGTVDRHVGDLERTGTGISGPVYDGSGFKLKLFPLPDSNTAITYNTNAPSGVYMSLRRNVSSSLKTSINLDTGEVKHSLTTQDDQLVRDSYSRPVDAHLETAASSSNGKWLAFEYSFNGISRLNVDTGEVLTFAPGYNGSDSSLNLAISGDGRYAAVSSYAHSLFRIYDLGTCLEASGPGQPANCQYRDLRSVIRTAMPDQFGTPSRISFTDDYTLKFYGTALEDGVRTHDVQLLSAFGHEPVEFSYLGLGDSFASGEGAFDYKAGTDEKSPKNKCHLSVNSYPYLLGAQLELNSYESVACSGAKIKDINGQFLGDYQAEKPEADGKSDVKFNGEIYDNFLPGYRMQKDFVDIYHPSKITISISGNDMGFGDIIKRCMLSSDDCYSRTSEREALAKTINDRFYELVSMYLELKQPVDSDVYVIGYPKLADQYGSCALNVHASKNELQFFDTLVGYINSVIKKAADNAGVYYVDTSDALLGHRLCEASPSDIAVNGLTAGNDKLFDIGPIGNESYHPNALGHKLLEAAILNKTHDFTAHNPAPKDVEAPQLVDATDFIGSAAYTYQNTKFYVSTDSSSIWWNKPDTKHFEQSGFAPGSQVTETLHSDPVVLGTSAVDYSGGVNADLSLPDSVEPGYHTLYISGQNVAGENVVYQKTVFVTASTDDYDGDGISNTQNPCLVVPLSGVDYDHDGIDDACDGQIVEPPATPTPIDSTVPLTGFDSQPGGDDTGIINPVNDGQNQNSTYTQPQVSNGGLQSQSAYVPVTNANTDVQGQGADLFGNSTDTASLLNQSQVLGTDTQASSQAPSTAVSVDTVGDNNHGLTPFNIALVLIVLIALTSIFRAADRRRNES